MTSTTRDVAAYLYSTGDYDISNEAGQKVLLDDAKASAEGGGLAGFPQFARAQPIRDWLAQQAQQIIADHPDFANMWERVFSREVE